MGMLFNIPNNEDREIVALLNREFSGKRFVRLQKHHKNKEKLFNPDHKLERVAWRLKLWPKKTPGDRAKGRWLVFLKQLAANPSSQIKAALHTACEDSNCEGVTFQVLEDSATLEHYVINGDYGPGERIPTENNNYIYALTLVCPKPFDPNQPGDPNPPPADSNEQPIDPP